MLVIIMMTPMKRKEHERQTDNDKTERTTGIEGRQTKEERTNREKRGMVMTTNTDIKSQTQISMETREVTEQDGPKGRVIMMQVERHNSNRTVSKPSLESSALRQT